MPGPSRFTPTEDREIAHIKSSARSRGVPERRAESMAYGHVVNQQKMHAGVKTIAKIGKSKKSKSR